MTPQVLTSGPARQDVGGELRPGSTDRIAGFLGILALLLTAIGYYAVPAVVSRLRVPGGDPLYRQAQLRLDDLLAGILAATFLLAPGVHRMSLPWRHRW